MNGEFSRGGEGCMVQPTNQIFLERFTPTHIIYSTEIDWFKILITNICCFGTLH